MPSISPRPRRNPLMAELTLEIARKILDAALAKGVEKKFKPLVVTVLDARGCVKITAAQDGTSLMRAEIANGKAYGALAMGMGSRALFQRSKEQPSFIGAMNGLAQGRLVPVPGGVLIMDGARLLGAVGVSGDTSDNDEICAVAGIGAAGLKAHPGESAAPCCVILRTCEAISDVILRCAHFLARLEGWLHALR